MWILVKLLGFKDGSCVCSCKLPDLGEYPRSEMSRFDRGRWSSDREDIRTSAISAVLTVSIHGF